MSVLHIKFQTRSEEVRGVEELAMNTRITAYRGGVYAVRQCDLTRLDSVGISYRLATEQEVQRALGSILGCTLPLRHTSVKKAGNEQFLELAGRSVSQRRMEPLLVIDPLNKAA